MKTGDPIEFALNQLNRRFMSKHALKRLLMEQGYFETMVEETLSQLENWGYLNDMRLALSIVSKWTVQKPKGRLYIRQKLLNEEIPTALIDEALETYSHCDEKRFAAALAHQYIQRKIKQSADPLKTKAALAGYLERGGFPELLIEEIVEELFFQIVSESSEIIRCLDSD